MKSLVLTRTREDDYQTLGELSVYDNSLGEIFKCKTLELPWKDNKRRVSRIPSNHYEIVKHISPRFGKSLWIKDVPNRSEILIHRGNYHRDTLGCILVGEKFYDIDNDGHLDVTNSKTTMERLYKIVENENYINIIEEWENQN